MDAVVLKYKDSVLRESDLDILRSPSYLNDAIIGFYFAYLTSLTESDDVLFIHPSVSDLLANNADDVDMVKANVEPLKFCSKNMIFFAVNGDEHWSLLVYDRNLNEFLHHDSSEGACNNMQAMKLYETLKDLVGPAKRVKNMKPKKLMNRSKKAAAALVVSNSAAPTVNTPPSFKECPTPQQANGYDCGLFVLAIARAICEWHCSKKKSKFNYWFKENQVNPSIVEHSMRSEVLNLVKDLSLKN